MATLVKFFPATAQSRCVSILRHDANPAAMRFEVIFQVPRQRGEVAWEFFSTRKAADQFAAEVR